MGQDNIHPIEAVTMLRPRGLMDKASDFESEDCEFESRRGRQVLNNSHNHIPFVSTY